MSVAVEPEKPQGGVAANVRRREDLILGRPPRVSPPEVITEEMRALAASPPGFADEMPGNYAILLHTPELLRLYKEVGAYFLIDGALSPRDRELAILRVGWLCQAPYEWGEHVALGRKIGLTADEIEWVIEGSTASGWKAHDRAILKAVEELMTDAMISDATWETLAATLTQAQLVELPLLIAQYQGVAYFFNSLRISLRRSNPGLSAR